MSLKQRLKSYDAPSGSSDLSNAYDVSLRSRNHIHYRRRQVGGILVVVPFPLSQRPTAENVDQADLT